MAWLTSGGIRGISTYLVFENKFAYNVNAISLFRTSPAVYRHKEEAMTEAVVAKQTGIELVLNQPRLHAAPKFFLIYFEDVLHVLGKIQDDRVSHGLPGQRCSAAARQHGYI